MVAKISQLQHEHWQYGGASQLLTVIRCEKFVEIMPGQVLEKPDQFMVSGNHLPIDGKVKFRERWEYKIAQHRCILRGHGPGNAVNCTSVPPIIRILDAPE
jgi:hypothetical protein